MEDAALTMTASMASSAGEGAEASRLREMFDANYELVWRVLRRMGVPEADVDDATQKCFVVASRRVADIRPGEERGFLFQTAVRTALTERRTRRRSRETGDEAMVSLLDPSMAPDEQLDHARKRALLDHILDTMPDDLRAAFVLFELEGFTTSEVASLQGLPQGTAASRIRRAREHFDAQVRRIQARRGKGAAT